jgi:diaminohydroxyphosphoribosylaminopyrimidine deaminase/5-amino-6-(5-phosphoribosylamino)uracil reductase
MVAEGADAGRVRALRDAGAVVAPAGSHGGRLDLVEVLAELHRREVRALLVEGGAEMHGAFLSAGLVDRVAVFVAPLLIGGREALSVMTGSGLSLGSAVRLTDLAVRTVGPDLLVEGDVERVTV